MPILVYHKIRPQKEVGITTVHPPTFLRQVEWLKENGYQAVTFHQIINAPIHNLPPKPVVISFDDGFAEVESIAAPILQQLGFVGVVFIIAGFIGKYSSWDVNLGGVGAFHLTASQIKNLAYAGWEIGSHTMTHRALSYLNTKALREELYQSRNFLEDLTGSSVTTIAYPFGMLNSRVIAEARQIGYRVGLGATSILKFQKHPLSLSRIPVFPWDTPFRLKRKLRQPLSMKEQLVSTVIRFPAIFSPLYQVLFRRFLWGVNRDLQKYG